LWGSSNTFLTASGHLQAEKKLSQALRNVHTQDQENQNKAITSPFKSKKDPQIRIYRRNSRNNTKWIN